MLKHSAAQYEQHYTKSLCDFKVGACLPVFHYFIAHLQIQSHSLVATSFGTNTATKL